MALKKPAKSADKPAATTPVLTKLDVSGLVNQIVEVTLVHDGEFKKFRVLHVDMGNDVITLRDKEKVLYYFPISSCFIRLKNYNLA